MTTVRRNARQIGELENPRSKILGSTKLEEAVSYDALWEIGKPDIFQSSFKGKPPIKPHKVVSTELHSAIRNPRVIVVFLYYGQIPIADGSILMRPGKL